MKYILPLGAVAFLAFGSADMQSNPVIPQTNNPAPSTLTSAQPNQGATQLPQDVPLENRIASFDFKDLIGNTNISPDMDYAFHFYDTLLSQENQGRLTDQERIADFIKGSQYNYVAIYKKENGKPRDKPVARVQVHQGFTHYEFDMLELTGLSGDGSDRYFRSRRQGWGYHILQEIWNEMIIKRSQVLDDATPLKPFPPNKSVIAA
jgi:hypothetical protein|tara:strand:+ start:33503 stop:34120 length:618 start_codon:yes stop_codon:yes gene_type:complete